MSMITGVLKQLRALFRKDAAERELGEEVGFHLEMEIAHNVQSGMTPAAARRRG